MGQVGRDQVEHRVDQVRPPLDDEHNAALAALAPRFGVSVITTTAAHFANPGRGRLAMAMGRSGRQSLTMPPAGLRHWGTASAIR